MTYMGLFQNFFCYFVKVLKGSVTSRDHMGATPWPVSVLTYGVLGLGYCFRVSVIALGFRLLL